MDLIQQHLTMPVNPAIKKDVALSMVKDFMDRKCPERIENELVTTKYSFIVDEVPITGPQDRRNFVNVSYWISRT